MDGNHDLSIRELAEIMKRHPETLRRFARTGNLPGAYKLGKVWRISKQAADKLRQIPFENRLKAQNVEAAIARPQQEKDK